MAHLFYQTAFIGDLFLSIPTLKYIKKLSPNEELVLACRKGLAEPFLKLGLVDRAFEIDKNKGSEWKQFSKLILNEQWQWYICPHQSLRSQLLARKAKAQVKVGFQDWWNFFIFNKFVARPMHLPEALRQLSLLAPLDDSFLQLYRDYIQTAGILNSTERSTVSFLQSTKIPDWASLSMKKDLLKLPRPSQLSGGHEKAVLLAPGSVWATKRWTLKGYIELSQELIAQGHNVILIGSPDEKELCQQIEINVPLVMNLCGQLSLTETLYLMSLSELLVANDSGAIHMAAVAELPTVSVFGPTTLNLGYRPWQNKSVVVQKDLSCRPCGKHGAQVCPIKTHACMKEISAKEIVSQVTLLKTLSH